MHAHIYTYVATHENTYTSKICNKNQSYIMYSTVLPEISLLPQVQNQYIHHRLE